MIGTYNYVLFTNDTGFPLQNWNGYQKAMDYIYDEVDPNSGLLNVTGIRDWARWQQGFNNSEAQMMYVPRPDSAIGENGKTDIATDCITPW